jgi:hypothetical protein
MGRVANANTEKKRWTKQCTVQGTHIRSYVASESSLLALNVPFTIPALAFKFFKALSSSKYFKFKFYGTENIASPLRKSAT